METPREIFMPCRYILSVNIEYHCSDEGKTAEETSSKIKYLDDNGVESILLITGSKSANTTTNVPTSSILGRWVVQQGLGDWCG